VKIEILTVGKPKASYVKDGLSEYLKRLKVHLPLSMKHVPDRSKRKNAEKVLEEEGKEILSTVGDEDFLVLLDVDGRLVDSVSFAAWVQKKLNETPKKLIFCVGGAYGVSEDVKRRANFLLSLSPMTFPHEMSLLILVEQLYRAVMINKGSAYHH